MRIGPIQLHVPFCQAGLAGYSDRAMRVVARRRGCPYAVTEALLDVIMLAGGQGLKKSIDIDDEDHPVAGQVIGSEPDEMARAAAILGNSGYDVVDLNFACPVKKIKNKARGGHMLFDTDRALAILKAARDAVPAHVPLTASLRRAFDDSAQAQDAFDRVIEAAWSTGLAAVRVHARTVEQKYAGRADWSVLKQIKQRYPTRTILGSGDVFTAHDAVRMLKETGVDVVWIARGAIGNPWIFRHATELLAATQRVADAPALQSANPEPLTLNPPSIAEQRLALAEHFAIAMQIHGESFAGRRMRKMGIKYARFHPEAAKVKHEFINVGSLRDWKRVLDTWYAGDGPGVWPAPDAADEVNGGGEASCEAAA
ncbi:MAG TPA: tRNA-dihydrouridine synthase [Tepidisphaeraceae bacterium]|nr:tRNA-dihydrouridine synthase [Tepidisphaeraceae bacterium]